MAVFMKKVNIPQKSDLINIDMTGSGTAQTYRVLKNVSGSVVEVVGMTSVGTGKFGSNNTYNGSDVDVALNTTWYGTLSETAKSAIVDKTFNQYMYQYNQGMYNQNTHASYADYVYTKAIKESNLTRHIYLIGVEDIEEYFSSKFSRTDLFDLLWISTPSQVEVIILSSAASTNTTSDWAINSNNKWISGENVAYTGFVYRPAFQIDLSKIDYTFTDGRSPLEFKPVSVFEKKSGSLNRVDMSWNKPATYPVKSDIVNIDMTGSGTPQQYRVLKINGSVAEVLGMTNVKKAKFGSSNTYENSDIDTYLNTTWYNALSETAKSAIVDKTFYQDSWTKDQTGNPIYVQVVNMSMPTQNPSYYSKQNATLGNQLTRHIYTIGLQDIVDYLDATPQMTPQNTTFTIYSIAELYFDATSGNGFEWTSSASGTDIFYISGGGAIYSLTPTNTNITYRPAFQIDLSKIDYTIQQ